MSGSSVDLAQMALADVMAACREQTRSFLLKLASDDSFCLELFRRAVCERSHAAWEAVLEQYRGMVLAWVRQHPTSAALREEDDYWINRTFERFWSAVGPERFGSFNALAGVLRYVKMCVHSVLMDEVRTQRKAQLEPLGEERVEDADDAPNAEEQVVNEVAAAELWSVILREVADEAERRVAYLSFALELKPAEIQERHPALFAGVDDVYRIKRNVVERLRRSPEIQELLR